MMAMPSSPLASTIGPSAFGTSADGTATTDSHSGRDRLPISAVIITRNAGSRITEVLRGVEMCAERLVLDSGSTDDTVALARDAGARVEHQPFLGYGLQKRRAVELAAHDWILSLDADEVLDGEAQAACSRLDLSDPAACWAFCRRTFVGRREVRHGIWQDERVLRLFNRTTAAFKEIAVHEEVESQRPPRMLAGSILHYSFVDCRRAGTVAPLRAPEGRHSAFERGTGRCLDPANSRSGRVREKLRPAERLA